MRLALLCAMVWFGVSSCALGQDCPRTNPGGPAYESVSRTLTGRVVYHTDYRQWLGLKLDAPVCGVGEIQLVISDRPGGGPEVQHLETYRGCRVRVSGVLDIPATTYYSTEVFQVVDKAQPFAGCRQYARFLDFTTVQPAKDVRRYSVTMRLNYKTNTPVRVSVRDGLRILTPEQVYAPYIINGGFSIAANCAEGFLMESVRGTASAKPFQVDGTAWLDPESAAARHVWNDSLTYTCHR